LFDSENAIMNEDPPPSPRESTGRVRGRWTWEPFAETSQQEDCTITTYSYSYEEPPAEPEWLVQRDPEKGTLQLTGPDGKTEVFRGRVLRYLEVEVDQQSGELRPVIRDGRPRILCLYQAVTGS
jgi:hypothetical protein